MQRFERCVTRPMQAADLSLVLAWRNHADVRRWMMTRHEIKPAEHAQWFERASTDNTRALLVGEVEGHPIGFANFSRVSAGGAADWGFYTAPGTPRGSGTRLCAGALDFAFRELRVHKVCGQALDHNVGSIRLHVKLGFVQEGTLREQQLVDSAHRDLICFGLLRREWL
jgi:UDP-4-amino-4,6-dideoxy-N-acetyl-beta-L-altrosamine N-acetyltransferase